MKKYKKITISCIALLLMIGLIGVSRADSGFDSSYDSGSSFGGSSSFDSGSSYSSWDSDSSWDSGFSGSSSHSTGDGSSGKFGISGAIMFIAFVVILVCIFKPSAIEKKSTDSSPTKFSVIPYDLKKIQEVLPDFDKEKFQNQVFTIYKDIQIAWMNFDYDTLRKNTTDELYNMYYSQLETLKIKNQKNIMDYFDLHDFEIISMEHDDKTISIKTRVMIECVDYIVDGNNRVVRGNQDAKNLYDYEMTFVRGVSITHTMCPNCGKELGDSHSTVCPYCNSTIVNENHDWVLSKKQMIRQKKL